LARSGRDVVGLAIIRFRLWGVKVQKGPLTLRASWFIAFLNYAYALCTCLAQPSLLGICLATAWRVKPLITSATKRSLGVLAESGFPRIHFSVRKSTGQRCPVGRRSAARITDGADFQANRASAVASEPTQTCLRRHADAVSTGGLQFVLLTDFGK
jgi:hypothetical protein